MKKIVTIMLSLILILSLSSCGKKTTNVSAQELIIPSVSGANGSGVATLSKNRDTIKKLASALYGENPTDLDIMKIEVLFEAGFEYKITNSAENLSNGDKLNISINYSVDSFKEAGINVTSTEFTYTVEGLSEPELIDVFAGVELKYTGTSPNGNVTIDNTNCSDFVKKNVQFKADPNYNIANGDKITVTATCQQKKLDENNYVIEKDTMDFVAVGINEYASDPSKYDLTIFDDEMAEKADKSISTSSYKLDTSTPSYKLFEGGNLSENWTIDLLDIVPVKTFFCCVPQDKIDSNSNNKYVTFYNLKVTATKTSKANKDGYNSGDTDTFDVYLSVTISGIQGDGNSILQDDCFISSSVYGNSIAGTYIGMSLDELVEMYKSDIPDFTFTELK